MQIYFICRGNAFRSVIAEAYLDSLKIPNIAVYSGGTVAGKNRLENQNYILLTKKLLSTNGLASRDSSEYQQDVSQALLDSSDIVVCMNQIVYDELASSWVLPSTVVTFNITDIGEPGREEEMIIDREKYMEIIYKEIVQEIDEFVQEYNLTNNGVPNG